MTSSTDGAACQMDNGYSSLMPRKDRKQKVSPADGGWFVYMVCCADGSLYTGITKDLARRCQQHNDGAASRYTRSRLPVKVVYREAHPSQSSALKREAAIKALTRQGKLRIAEQGKASRLARKNSRPAPRGKSCST